MLVYKVKQCLVVLLLLACSAAAVVPAYGADGAALNSIGAVYVKSTIARFADGEPFGHLQGQIPFNPLRTHQFQKACSLSTVALLQYPVAAVSEGLLLTLAMQWLAQGEGGVSFNIDYWIDASSADAPPEYADAAWRVEYWLDCYEGTTFSEEYRIGRQIHDVYDIMP